MRAVVVAEIGVRPRIPHEDVSYVVEAAKYPHASGCWRVPSGTPHMYHSVANYVTNNAEPPVFVPNAFCQLFWLNFNSTIASSNDCGIVNMDEAGFKCTVDGHSVYDYCHTWAEVASVYASLTGSELIENCLTCVLQTTHVSTSWITPNALRTRPVDTAYYNDLTQHTIVLDSTVTINMQVFITVHYNLSTWFYERGSHTVALYSTEEIEDENDLHFMCVPLDFTSNGFVKTVTRNFTVMTNAAILYLQFETYGFYGTDAFRVTVKSVQCDQTVIPESLSLINDCEKCSIPNMPSLITAQTVFSQHRVEVNGMSDSMVGINIQFHEAPPRLLFINDVPFDALAPDTVRFGLLLDSDNVQNMLHNGLNSNYPNSIYFTTPLGTTLPRLSINVVNAACEILLPRKSLGTQRAYEITLPLSHIRTTQGMTIAIVMYEAMSGTPLQHSTTYTQYSLQTNNVPLFFPAQFALEGDFHDDVVVRVGNTEMMYSDGMCASLDLNIYIPGNPSSSQPLFISLISRPDQGCIQVQPVGADMHLFKCGVPQQRILTYEPHTMQRNSNVFRFSGSQANANDLVFITLNPVVHRDCVADNVYGVKTFFVVSDIEDDVTNEFVLETLPQLKCNAGGAYSAVIINHGIITSDTTYIHMYAPLTTIDATRTPYIEPQAWSINTVQYPHCSLSLFEAYMNVALSQYTITKERPANPYVPEYDIRNNLVSWSDIIAMPVTQYDVSAGSDLTFEWYALLTPFISIIEFTEPVVDILLYNIYFLGDTMLSYTNDNIPSMYVDVTFHVKMTNLYGKAALFTASKVVQVPVKIGNNVATFVNPFVRIKIPTFDSDVYADTLSSINEIYATAYVNRLQKYKDPLLKFNNEAIQLRYSASFLAKTFVPTQLLPIFTSLFLQYNEEPAPCGMPNVVMYKWLFQPRDTFTTQGEKKSVTTINGVTTSVTLYSTFTKISPYILIPRSLDYANRVAFFTTMASPAEIYWPYNYNSIHKLVIQPLTGKVENVDDGNTLIYSNNSNGNMNLLSAGCRSNMLLALVYDYVSVWLYPRIKGWHYVCTDIPIPVGNKQTTVESIDISHLNICMKLCPMETGFSMEKTSPTTWIYSMLDYGLHNRVAPAIFNTTSFLAFEERPTTRVNYNDYCFLQNDYYVVCYDGNTLQVKIRSRLKTFHDPDYTQIVKEYLNAI